MKVKVVKGSVVYEGKEYVDGDAFECSASIAESLLVASKVEQAQTQDDTDEQKGKVEQAQPKARKGKKAK